jgi:peroxiredoxin Q/BCP
VSRAKSAFVTLQPGDDAPAVSAPNQDGETVEPDFEEPTVLYFYPRDDTPGCTTEANQFEREGDAYRDAGATVYGVSTDGVDSHRAFADEQDLNFDLLADPEGEIAAAFGVELRRGAARRTTFVLADGAVQRVYTAVSPDGHARDVLMDALDDGLVTLEE